MISSSTSQDLLAHLREEYAKQVARNDQNGLKISTMRELLKEDDKHKRFNGLLKALCKNSVIGGILSTPTFFLATSTIEKGRLRDVARLLNDMANDEKIKIDPTTLGTLFLQITNDAPFAALLKSRYQVLYKRVLYLFVYIEWGEVSQLKAHPKIHLTPYRDDLVSLYLMLIQACERLVDITDAKNKEAYYALMVEAYWYVYKMTDNEMAAKKLAPLLVAKEWSGALKFEAATNDSTALFYFGLRHFAGIGCDRNEELAAGSFIASSDLGNADAKYYLGYMHFIGLVFPKDEQKALQYFTDSANGGNGLAIQFLANQYLDGDKNVKNVEKGVALYQKAAELGVVYAQEALAFIYRDGEEGIEINIPKAIVWSRRANTLPLNKLHNDMGEKGYALFSYSNYLKEINVVVTDENQTDLSGKEYQSLKNHMNHPIKNELVASMFGEEDKNKRYNLLLKGLCKKTKIGDLLATPVLSVGTSSIAKNRLKLVADEVNAMVKDDVQAKLTIEPSTLALLREQANGDVEFRGVLKSKYPDVFKKIFPNGLDRSFGVTLLAGPSEVETEMSDLSGRSKTPSQFRP